MVIAGAGVVEKLHERLQSALAHRQQGPRVRIFQYLPMHNAHLFNAHFSLPVVLAHASTSGHNQTVAVLRFRHGLGYDAFEVLCADSLDASVTS
jgi:hypothetical protein